MSASRDAVFRYDGSRGSEGLAREVQLSHIITALSSRSQDFFGYHADQALNNLSIPPNVPRYDELNISENFAV